MREEVERWIHGWARGWATHDVELIDALYADDAVHVSAFFRDPQPTAEYAAWAFSDEASAEVWFAEPVIDGRRAAVAWWAISRGADGGVEAGGGRGPPRLLPRAARGARRERRARHIRGAGAAGARQDRELRRQLDQRRRRPLPGVQGMGRGLPDRRCPVGGARDRD